MQKPLPNPSLMLPAIDLSSTPTLDHTIEYKRKEAKWKRMISETHKDWCLCGSFLNHFLKPDQSLKNEDPCTEDAGGEEAAGAEGGGDGPEEDILTEEDFIEGVKE